MELLLEFPNPLLNFQQRFIIKMQPFVVVLSVACMRVYAYNFKAAIALPHQNRSSTHPSKSLHCVIDDIILCLVGRRKPTWRFRPLEYVILDIEICRIFGRFVWIADHHHLIS